MHIPAVEATEFMFIKSIINGNCLSPNLNRHKRELRLEKIPRRERELGIFRFYSHDSTRNELFMKKPLVDFMRISRPSTHSRGTVLEGLRVFRELGSSAVALDDVL